MPTAHILIVDDDKDFRETTGMVLERAGYAVREAENGLQALHAIDAAPPDLVLVDVSMPVMSGPQLVDELRRRGEKRPFGIIALSGKVDARSSPTKWFLAKPLSAQLLLAVVGDFCGKRAASPLWVHEQHRESLTALQRFQPV